MVLDFRYSSSAFVYIVEKIIDQAPFALDPVLKQQGQHEKNKHVCAVKHEICEYCHLNHYDWCVVVKKVMQVLNLKLNYLKIQLSININRH